MFHLISPFYFYRKIHKKVNKTIDEILDKQQNTDDKFRKVKLLNKKERILYYGRKKERNYFI